MPVPSDHRQRVHYQKKALLTLLRRVPSHQQEDLLRRIRNDALAMAPTPDHDASTPGATPQHTPRDTPRDTPKKDPRDQWIILGLAMIAALAPLSFSSLSFVGNPDLAKGLIGVASTGFLAVIVITQSERYRLRKPRFLRARHKQHRDESPEIILQAIDELLQDYHNH